MGRTGQRTHASPPTTLCLPAFAACQERVNGLCHDAGVKFYAGDCFGYTGFFFVDLGAFKYTKCVHCVYLRRWL